MPDPGPAAHPERARRLGWPEPFTDLTDALARLAEVTVRRVPPDDASLDPAVLGTVGRGRSGGLLAAAWRQPGPARDLGTVPRRPRAADLARGRRQVEGMVDWEAGQVARGSGCRRWHAMLTTSSSASGWCGRRRTSACAASKRPGPRRALRRRTASRRTVARAAGVPEARLDSLELALGRASAGACSRPPRTGRRGRRRKDAPDRMRVLIVGEADRPDALGRSGVSAAGSSSARVGGTGQPLGRLALDPGLQLSLAELDVQPSWKRSTGDDADWL